MMLLNKYILLRKKRRGKGLNTSPNKVSTGVSLAEAATRAVGAMTLSRRLNNEADSRHTHVAPCEGPDFSLGK